MPPVLIYPNQPLTVRNHRARQTQATRRGAGFTRKQLPAKSKQKAWRVGEKKSSQLCAQCTVRLCALLNSLTPDSTPFHQPFKQHDVRLLPRARERQREQGTCCISQIQAHCFSPSLTTRPSLKGDTTYITSMLSIMFAHTVLPYSRLKTDTFGYLSQRTSPR